METKLEVLVLQLGALRVFALQTAEEHLTNAGYKEVYWRNIMVGNSYGPFPNVYECMKHYAWICEQQKANPETKLGQVIYVDFRSKRRVVYA